LNDAPGRLGVLGSPISHSRSPLLHRAAYDALGLTWTYDAIELSSDALPQFLRSRTPEWRGFSLTMPLKRAVLPLLDSMDDAAESTGGANTVLFGESDGVVTYRGFNTDVYGITESFRAAGIEGLESVRLLGSGATATSALLAVARLGAKRVDVSARTPSNAASLQRLGERLGARVTIAGLDSAMPLSADDAVISTIPGGAPGSISFDEETMKRATLFDVTYDPWPTPLAEAWHGVGGRVISGLEMLLRQAVVQVRIFVGGDPDQPLADEPRVLAAMRRAVALD
jgi:shikimate dehydrogenase